MGGLVPALGEALARGIEKDDSLGAKAMSLAGNKEWELDLNPEGKAIKAMDLKYKEIRASSLQDSTKHLDAVKKFHQSSDTVRNAVDLKTGTLGDIAKLAPAIHQFMQTIGELARKDPNHLNTPLPKIAEKIQGQARLDGIAGSFGSKYENLAPLIGSMLEHSDPRVNLNGRRVLDIISNELQDTKSDFKQGSSQPASGVKMGVRDVFNTVNTLRKRAGTTKMLPSVDVSPTYYPPSKAEKVANDVLRTVQIPFVAIPHIGQYFHIAASSPLTAIGKGLLGMDKAEMDKTIEASGILAHSQWDVIHSDLLARTGKVAKWTNSPTAASILAKVIHTPGFNYLRLKQLSVAGSVGFHSAIYWAHNALKGDQASLARLGELGINFQDVVKQKGQLTDEQLAKGVYHFVNNRFFFDKSLDNSLWQNKNFFMRSAFMYHSFISSETAYLGRELRLMTKARDYKGLAQFVGTLGVVFPMVAPMLKSLEILARTASPKQAGQSIQKDYKGLTHPDSFGEWSETYLDMVAHLGAMGAAYNYTNAIKASRLANAAVGPMIGMGLTDIQDAGKAGIDLATKGWDKTNLKPLGRDITQLIPVAGKPLSHKLFPTTKESKEESTSTHRHTLGRAKRRFK